MTENSGNDIRNKVENDRSLLKKIELFIPGFSGYREKEDIRSADELLRSQLAKMVDESTNNLKDLRQNLVNCFKLEPLNQLGTLISNAESLKNIIVDAEQGYSGIAFSIQIDDRTLDNLYEYDYGILSSLDKLIKMTESAENLCDEDTVQIVNAFNNMNDAIKQARQYWNMRIESVENIKVK
ncbi:hypothetical protein ACNF42_07655 [Cuniculiplasma sp. SKW3]|uniref:hypothetical protein n=1 Tax=Cuniculiplasma sp. SKW3 TaxID=3400170 RepID=UPI003FD6621B